VRGLCFVGLPVFLLTALAESVVTVVELAEPEFKTISSFEHPYPPTKIAFAPEKVRFVCVVLSCVFPTCAQVAPGSAGDIRRLPTLVADQGEPGMMWQSRFLIHQPGQWRDGDARHAEPQQVVRVLCSSHLI
jgi:hypothetical protein